MNFDFSHWRSLKFRVILFTLSVFLLGIWSLSWLASRSLREDMQGLLGAQQFSTASQMAAQADLQISERLAALGNVAAEIRPDLLRRPQALQTFLEQHTLLAALFNGGVLVLGPDGGVLADGPRSKGRIGANWMNRDGVATALTQGRTAIGRPAVDPDLHAPAFAMAVPIRDARGKVIGALDGVTNLGEPSFLDEFTKHTYGTTGGYFIAAPRYRLNITATDRSRVMQQLPPPGVSPVIDRFVQGYEGTLVHVNQMGVEVLVSVKRIAVADWAMVVNLPTEEAFAPIRAMQRRMGLITAFFTLLAGGLTWWMAWLLIRRELSPILTATRALDNLADASQSTLQLPVSSQNEIGTLIGSFNRLLSTVAQREDALRASEARFRGIFENANTGIASTDRSGRVNGFNEAFRSMLGFAAAALGQMSFTEFTDAQDLQQEQVYVDEILAGQREHYRMNKRYIASDGHVVWVDISVAAIRDGQGQVLNLVAVVQDITERRQAQVLQASEAFKQAILNSVMSEIAVLDRYGVILNVNEAWRRFALNNSLHGGQPVPGTDVGSNYLAVCECQAGSVIEEARQACDGIRAVLDGHQSSFSLEYPCHSPRQERWFSMSVTPLGERSQDGVVIAHTDITERKLHERLAQERAAQNQAILDHVLDGIVTIDGEGMIQTMNRSALATFGFEAHEVTGRNVSILMPEPHRSQHDTYLKNYRDSGVTHIIGSERELVGWRKDGGTFPMELAVSQSVHQGQPLFIGVVRDISGRKLAQEALRASEQLARTIANNIPGMVAYWNRELRCTFANVGYVEWFGRTPEQMHGMRLQDLLGDALFQSNLPHISAVLAGEDQRFERVLTKHNGEVGYTWAQYIAHVHEGQVQGFFVLVTDVTEIKRAEVALARARDEAEAASRAKSEFLASMSHELRTPLNAVLGYAQLIAIAVDVEANIKDQAGEIHKAGKHLLSLVNDLMDLARIESGKLELSMQSVAVYAVVEQSLRMVAPIAKKHGITLVRHLGAADTAKVCVDEVRLCQVIVNLLSNAIKYNRPHGSVSLSGTVAGGQMRLSVVDTGPGIATHKQERLFTAFDRLGEELGTVEGSGIGLNISRRLIEAMGGAIGFETQQGTGSTFWVEFAVLDELAQRVVPSGMRAVLTGPATAGLNRRAVLHIEDNPINQRLIRQIFTVRQDLALTETHNAELGIELARIAPPALILMDLNLPGMDGYAALKVLRSDPRTALIPVIAVSANAMKGEQARGLAAGFVAYVTKPLDVSAFLALMDRVLETVP